MSNKFSKIAVFLILWVASITVVWADANSTSDMDATSGSTLPEARGKRRAGGKRLNTSAAQKDPTAVIGHCSVQVSASNPLAGPCVNLLLIIYGPDGTEAAKTRTDANGRFDFTAEPDKAYKIESGSKFYEAVPLKAPIHGGDRINLQLRQK